MKISVTGATGFIGRHLIERLLYKGYKIQLLSRSKQPDGFESPSLRIVQGDIKNLTHVNPEFWDCDCLVHLANSTNPQHQDAIIDVQDNLIPLINILKLARNHKVSRMIFASTAAVYGNIDCEAVNEMSRTNPISPYGIIKHTMENFIRQERHMFGMEACILRLSNPYGPGQLGGIQGVVANFMKAAMTSEEINIFGDGSAIRDFIYIDDIVTAFENSIVSNVSGIFNIGTGVGVSIKQLIEEIGNITGKSLRVKYQPGRKQEIQKMVFDITKARKGLKWSPAYTLKDGLLAQKEWYLNNCSE